MKWMPFLFLVAVVISSGTALQIKTEITGTIDGYIDYLNYKQTLNDIPQELSVNWVNSGSVGCKARMRVDVMKDDTLVYSAWSRESSVEPGSYDILETRFQPNVSGSYTMNVRFYYCNMILDGPQLNFTAYVSNRSRENPFNVTIDNDMKTIRLTVKSDRDLDKVIVIPQEYPFGWVVESGALNLTKNEPKTILIGYSPEIWKPEDVRFLVTSSDGAYSLGTLYKLKGEEGYDIKNIAICALAAACIILAIAFVFIYKKSLK